MLFGTGMGLLADSTPVQWNSGSIDPNASSSAKPNFGKT
jgi:hypothetical protein